MAESSYDVGDVAHIYVVFTDTETGDLVDPDAVSLIVVSPNGIRSQPLVTNDSTGQYHVDVPITASGTWRYRWQSTGTGAGAEEGRFYVKTQTVL